MFVHFDQYNYKEPEGYGNSFLFAGCSITANVGLDEVPASGFGGWSRFLTEMLQDELEISAVNNCSISGASTFEIISNVFRFLNNYHKPNFIFLLLPPIHRESSSYARNVSAAQIIDYNIFSILHNYCKENNISLFASTWDFYISGITDWFVDDTNSDLSEKTLKEFDSFFIPNKKEFSKMFLRHL